MPPNAQQKTEKPTQRRRRRAREQGTVAQSAEVNNALVLLAGVGALVLFGGYTFPHLTGYMAGRLGNLGALTVTQEGVLNAVSETVGVLIKVVLPLMILVGCVGLLCSVMQTGIMVVPKRILPNLSLIDPIRGVKNLFSLSAVMRFLVAVVKLTVIVLIAYFLVRSRLSWIVALVGKSAWGILDASRRLCLSLMLQVSVAMMAVAVLDYAYQRWQHEKQLMMTKQEVRDERKRDEGDPQIRTRQAQRRRAVAQSRMMQAVPEATVVVSNPTQIAVALKWDEDAMSAPTVVAKGRNYLAERIRKIAREHDVPLIERKELARTLYETVEVGAEIPANLFYAVAEILAFVLRKRKPRRPVT